MTNQPKPDCPYCATYHEMAANLSAMHDRSHDAYAALTLSFSDMAGELRAGAAGDAPLDVSALIRRIEKVLDHGRLITRRPLFHVRSGSKARPAPTNEEIADQLGDLVKRVTAMHAEAVAYAELARNVQAGQLPLPAGTD